MHPNNIPHIVRETNNGLARITLADEMMARRELECSGEITPEQTDVLCRAMRWLDRQDASSPIRLYINSPGGRVDAGLALLDTMRALSAPVVTICQGMAASMASVLFACGDRRWILPHATVMIHDPRLQEWTRGSAQELRETGARLMESRKIIAAILADATGKTIQQIYRKTCRDSYFTAEEAVAFGLADAVLTSYADLCQPEGDAGKRTLPLSGSADSESALSA